MSCHLPICTMRDHFLDFSLAFFRQLMRNFGTSEPASSNEKTKQRFANMPKAEMGCPNFEGFLAQLHCKCTYGNKNQT